MFIIDSVSDHYLILIAFISFRIFDIYKLYPANKAEELHGAHGVIMDDIVAGIYALFVVFVSLQCQLLAQDKTSLLVKLSNKNNFKISVAESCTGGVLSSSIIEVYEHLIFLIPVLLPIQMQLK